MPLDRPTAQNVRAGVGVVLALGIGSAAVWFGLWMQRQGFLNYTVRFTPAQGVYGLRQGSIVRVGGLVKGEVVEVRPQVDAGVVVAYLVDFTLPKDIPLFTAARIQAAGDAMGGESALEIVDLGRGRALSGVQPRVSRDLRPAAEGHAFAAADPAEFDGLVGPGRSHKLRALAEAFQSLRGPVTHVTDDAPPRIAAVREEWNSLSTAMRADMDGWRSQWNTLAERAQRAVQSIGSGDSAAPDAVVPGLRALRADLEAMNLEPDKRRFERARSTIAGAIGSLDSIQAHGFAIRNALSDADIGLGFAAADFAIAGQELSATTSEVFASPWRLLAGPSAQQVAAAARLEEARIFAQAATEFEASVAAMRQTLEEDGPLLARTPGLADLLATRIGASTAAFDAAVARYTDALLGPRAVPAAPAVQPPPRR